MRISDWSSDVCSSDLVPITDQQEGKEAGQFPEEGHLHQVSGQDNAEHRAHESKQERKEARNGIFRGHVIARIKHRSEEHTSELQSLMRISYAVFCLKKKNQLHNNIMNNHKQTNYAYKQKQHTK